MTDYYFGYTSADNTQLHQLQQMQHHVGEDLMHYPEADTSGMPQYNPTINWNDKQYSDDGGMTAKKDYGNQAQADTIEKIYKRIMGQSASQVSALSDQWFKVSMVIENIRDSIYNEALALQNGSGGKGGWHSPAAKVFLQRGPGAAAKSLDDWYSAAISNSLGLTYLYNAILDQQAQMEVLWGQYKQAMVQAAQDYNSSYGDGSSSTTNNKASGEMPGDQSSDPQYYVTYLRQAAEEWHQKARDRQYKMAQAYWDVVNNNLNGGVSTIFEGPTDAVMPDPKFLNPFGPSLPNMGPPPGLGNGPGATPNLQLNLQQPPGLNISNNNVSLTNQPNLTAPQPTNLNLVVPQAGPGENAPNLPNLQPPGGVPNPSSAPSLDPSVIDAATGLALNQAMLTGSPGGAPGVGPAPGTSGLGSGQGSMGKGLGEAPPATPRLNKGALRRPSMPGGEGEGGGGRAPQSPGVMRNKGTGRPEVDRPVAPTDEEFGRPTGQGATPPVLRGRSAVGRPPGGFDERQAGIDRSAGSPARPGSGPPVLNRKKQSGSGQLGGAPVGPVDDDVLRPTQPGASAPILRGSRPPTGPEETEPPARALRSSASARRAPAGDQQIASRRKGRDQEKEREKERIDREFERIQGLLNEDEPWTVATPGGAVLDNTPERTGYQVEPKPTLGGGATA